MGLKNCLGIKILGSSHYERVNERLKELRMSKSELIIKSLVDDGITFKKGCYAKHTDLEFITPDSIMMRILTGFRESMILGKGKFTYNDTEILPFHNKPDPNYWSGRNCTYKSYVNELHPLVHPGPREAYYHVRYNMYKNDDIEEGDKEIILSMKPQQLATKWKYKQPRFNILADDN